MSENHYELSDRASKLLNRKAVRRFEAARRKLSDLKFDELNVIKTVKNLYRDLAADNKKAFFDLAVMAYQDAQPHGKKEPDMSWLLALLDSYDPVYLVVYTHEVERKRDRLIEGVIASSSKYKEFRRGLSLWSRFTGHELDRVTDEATLKSFRDAGVKKVSWRTEDDEKVCETCGPRDGKVYDIDKVPAKPHINCRCWLESVND